MVNNIAINVHLFLCRSTIKRNAWCAPVCLGLHTKPHFAPFTAKTMEGGMAGLVTEEGEDTSEFQCFPLARFPKYSPPDSSPTIPPCKFSQIFPLARFPKYCPSPGFPNISLLLGSPSIPPCQVHQTFPPALFPKHSLLPGFPDISPCQVPQNQIFPAARFPKYFPSEVSQSFPHCQVSPNISPAQVPPDIPTLKIPPHQHSPCCRQPDCQLPQP